MFPRVFQRIIILNLSDKCELSVYFVEIVWFCIDHVIFHEFCNQVWSEADWMKLLHTLYKYQKAWLT